MAAQDGPGGDGDADRGRTEPDAQQRGHADMHRQGRRVDEKTGGRGDAAHQDEVDDRAALGLAGVAVKAGARSAVATLWSVNDEASAGLIADFYRELKQPGVSRAVALQRAQVKLLSDPRYQHPGFWSPFLLINNWL